MNDPYPFVGIVKDRELGNYVSMKALEERGASTELIKAIVHGPFELAVNLMSEWGEGFVVEINPQLINST